LPFQRSNVKASDLRTGGPKSNRCSSISTTSQPELEVVGRPLPSRSLNQRADRGAVLLAAAGRREGDDVVRGARGVVNERLRADVDLVSEEGGGFVGVAGAADVSHTSVAKSPASQIHVASRHEQSCDSSG
jgi:hypothetical protein